MSIEIWLPNGINPRPVIDRCRVPVGNGQICGTPFFEGEEHVKDRHYIDCCRRNHEHIVAEREKQHPSILKPWDTEYAAWIEKNRDALLEGRKRG